MYWEEINVPHKWNHIIGIKGLSVLALEYRSGSLWIEARISAEPNCPGCGAKHHHLHLKDSFPRTIQHDLLGSRLTFIRISVPKFRCRRCCRFFRQPIPGVLPYQRATESFRKDLATKHQLGISKEECSKLFAVSHSKVERCYKHVHAKKILEQKNRPYPRVLGIDEHFLNRRIGYVTTLVDLKSRRVFDLLPGRSELALEAHLKRLKGRENVRVVVMDLSSTYRALVQKYFPNASIVADRFHVIRLINHSLLNLWKQFDEKGRKHRGLISLMRRHRFNLSPKQQQNLQRYFDEFPALGLCYHKLKDLKELMLHKGSSRSQTRWDLIPKLLALLQDLQNAPFAPLLKLAKTIQSWLEPIARMWRFSRTNSITEGLHNKMELIQRRAFGFHSFENYRIRVIALCG